MKTSTQHTLTAMEMTAQMTLTESKQYGGEKSSDRDSSLGKNASSSLKHETAQVMTVEVENRRRTVQLPGASGLNIRSEDGKTK